jgi:hypothetical protein
VQVQARNLLLFSRREAAQAAIRLPSNDSRAQHIRHQLKCAQGDIVRIGVVNGLKERPSPSSLAEPEALPSALPEHCTMGTVHFFVVIALHD